jgi:predicted nucleotidyltransferase
MNRSAVLLRLPPDLHGELKREAAASGVSLNSFGVQMIKEGLQGRSSTGGRFEPLVNKLREIHGEKLEGIILFGSEARGDARSGSDIDLLIVLAPEVPISRDLYREWDEHIPDRCDGRREVNPHFVHIPGSPEKAGGIWLECALEGTAIYDRSGNLGKVLREIRERIAAGVFRRKFAHGHPYWIREQANGIADGK